MYRTEPIKLTEVFVANGQPLVTYAERKNIELDMEEALYKRGKIINLIGPSKIGKTVTARHLARENDYILIHCGVIKTLENFYEAIFDKFNRPSEVIMTDSSMGSETYSLGTRLVAKAQAILGISLEANATATHSHQQGQTNSSKYTISSIAAKLGDIFRDESMILIIDDFHYLERELQKNLLLVLKGWSSNKNTIILTSVTHRKGEIVQLVPELRGRTTDIETSLWKNEELEEIIKKGEKALNFEISDSIKANIVSESFGNPMLIQEICFSLCFRNNIRERCEDKKVINLEVNELNDLLIKIASDMSFENLIEAYTVGKDTKGKNRNIYYFKDGSKKDIYQSIMFTLKKNMKIEGISVDEISQYIYDNVENILNNKSELVQPNLSLIKNSVARTIQYINDIDDMHAPKNNLGIKYVDYKEESKEFYIMDPFFAFKIKWSD